MPDKSNEKLGKVHITQHAISSIACQAVLKSYGVTGVASRKAMGGIASNVTRDPKHGIEVHLHDNSISIDVYVVIAYGTRIWTVAESVIDSVRFEVEKSLGVPVEQVNVYVQGVHLGLNEQA